MRQMSDVLWIQLCQADDNGKSLFVKKFMGMPALLCMNIFHLK